MDRRKALLKAGLWAGGTIAMPTMISLLQSCKTEPRLTWKPLFFTEDEAKTISKLADMILPRTETPGALDVKVDLFIDKVIAKTYDEKGQENMRSEISTFNTDCETNFGDVFLNLNEKGKIEVLKVAETTSGKFNPGVWGTTIGSQEPIGFYRAFKSMVIWAYFTSEKIGEKVLSYDPIPGDYDGCKPLSEIGNRWSL